MRKVCLGEAQAQHRFDGKDVFNYHSHPDTDLKLRQISTTSPLFVAGATLNPVHSCTLYLIFIFHFLSLSLSHLRSAVCHPSLSRSLHMFSISPCTDYTHTLPYLLLIHICQHINGLIRSRMLSYARILGTQADL